MNEPAQNFLTSTFYGVRDPGAFVNGMQTAISQIHGHGNFASDNLFTINRNLSFLEDADFMRAFEMHTETVIEKSVIWRNYILAWAARRAMNLPGDFVECGCYRGISARLVCDYVGFRDSEKTFYLYDLFEHGDAMDHHAMPAHSTELYDEVCERFSDFSNVRITSGAVPESFDILEPEGDIAFLHIDMNNAAAEVSALERLFDKVVTGAVVVFDDYGWRAYREQKTREDEFFARRGFQVLELPTGQGMIIK